MRLLLAELAPKRGDPAANLARLDRVVRAHPADLAVFPELYLTGYAVGHGFHAIAESVDGPIGRRLVALANETKTAIVTGGATRSLRRRGELHNTLLLAAPGGPVTEQVKRFLPTYGPFEEGSLFTPTETSRTIPLGPVRIGPEICYDAFFPEVSRELALDGADLLVVISAAPVTSSRLFDKVLPARAVENAVPLVYVNRVGVEDSLVFGGGSRALDARGENRPLEELPLEGSTKAEHLYVADIDLDEARRWRPFRPVLRDVRRSRGDSPHDPQRSTRTDPL